MDLNVGNRFIPRGGSPRGAHPRTPKSNPNRSCSAILSYTFAGNMNDEIQIQIMSE